MRICYIADTNHIFFERLASYFIEKGHEIHAIPIFKIARRMKSVSYHDVGELVHGSMFSRVPKYLKARNLIRDLKPDIVHAVSVRTCGWVGALARCHPFVISVMGSDIFINPTVSMARKYLTQFALKTADVLTSESEAVRSRTIALEAKRTNNYIIQWGVDLEAFRPGLDTRAIKKQLDIDKQFVVLSTRNFAPIYNIDVIVKAARLVLQRASNVIFVFKSYIVDKDEQIKIQNLIKEFKIDKSVRIIYETEYEEMPMYYNLADFFISVPSSDSLSVSLLEAMACGVVPVVSDLPATREWVNDGENGLIVPVRNEKALADAILTLFMDKSMRERFKKRNLDLVKKADFFLHMSRLENLYMDIWRRYQSNA